MRRQLTEEIKGSWQSGYRIPFHISIPQESLLDQNDSESGSYRIALSSILKKREGLKLIWKENNI